MAYWILETDVSVQFGEGAPPVGGSVKRTLKTLNDALLKAASAGLPDGEELPDDFPLWPEPEEEEPERSPTKDDADSRKNPKAKARSAKDKD